MGRSLLFVFNLYKNEPVNTHTVILMFIQGETGKDTGIREKD